MTRILAPVMLALVLSMRPGPTDVGPRDRSWRPASAGPSQGTSPQPPRFRSGATLVNVDVYPTRDGQVVEGLKAGDFEVLEDGAPQQVEFFEFLQFGINATDSDRRDPQSVQESNQLAGDPRHRAFVAFFDLYHLTGEGMRNARTPVLEFLHRSIGRSDYFAALNTDVSPRDITFSQRTETIEAAVDKYWPRAFVAELKDRPMTPEEKFLTECFINRTRSLETNQAMVAELLLRLRLEKLFDGMQGLVDRLRDLREARTTVLFFSSGWSEPGQNTALASQAWKRLPQIQTVDGKPTTNAPRGADGSPAPSACDAQLNKLSDMDFRRRHVEIVNEARKANVSFVSVDPGGLGSFDVQLNTMASGTKTTAEYSRGLDVLRELAINTDGAVIVATNDIRTPLRRVADNLSSYYLLGYYSTNTKLDGKYRQIAVKVKRPEVTKVSARRGYAGLSEAAVAERARAADVPAAAAPNAIDGELERLDRLQRAGGLYLDASVSGDEAVIVVEVSSGGGDVTATLTDAGGGMAGRATGAIDPRATSAVLRVKVDAAKGPWRAAVDAGPPGDRRRGSVDIPPPASRLVGAPILYRATPAPASPLRPVADRQFRRTERLHAEWLALQPLDSRSARLLDRTGQPLPVGVALTERDVAGRPGLVADLNLAPLAAGTYIVELTAGHGADAERSFIAFRVKP